MNTEETIEEFKNIVLESRNTSINILNKVIANDRLKSPFDDAKALYDLVDSLDQRQKSLLVKGYPYLLDNSFFKLLYKLENSDDPITISVEATDKNGEITSLINTNEDLELSSKYWGWIGG